MRNMEAPATVLFFLHVRDGDAVLADEEGGEFPSLAAVRTEAIARARELMSQGVLNGGKLGLERVFDIADETGRTVLMVPFREAVC
jgi:hypothetical protein